LYDSDKDVWVQLKGSAGVYVAERIIRRFREELYRKVVDILLLFKFLD